MKHDHFVYFKMNSCNLCIDLYFWSILIIIRMPKNFLKKKTEKQIIICKKRFLNEKITFSVYCGIFVLYLHCLCELCLMGSARSSYMAPFSLSPRLARRCKTTHLGRADVFPALTRLGQLNKVHSGTESKWLLALRLKALLIIFGIYDRYTPLWLMCSRLLHCVWIITITFYG